MKMIRAALKVPLCIIAAIILLLIIVSAINDIASLIFAMQLDSIQVPDGVEFLERQAQAGKLSEGNAETIDFLVCQLIRTDMDERELAQALVFPQWRKAKWERSFGAYMEILPVDAPTLEGECLGFAEITFKSLEETADFTGYYAIVLYDYGYDSGLDLRGH